MIVGGRSGVRSRKLVILVGSGHCQKRTHADELCDCVDPALQSTGMFKVQRLVGHECRGEEGEVHGVARRHAIALTSKAGEDVGHLTSVGVGDEQLLEDECNVGFRAARDRLKDADEHLKPGGHSCLQELGLKEIAENDAGEVGVIAGELTDELQIEHSTLVSQRGSFLRLEHMVEEEQVGFVVGAGVSGGEAKKASSSGIAEEEV